MKELAWIILRIFLVNLLNLSAVSIDDGFGTRAETLTCSNQVICIYFAHCLHYGGLQRFYSIKGVLTPTRKY